MSLYSYEPFSRLCTEEKFTQGNVIQTEDGCGHYVCVTFYIQMNQVRLLLV